MANRCSHCVLAASLAGILCAVFGGAPDSARAPAVEFDRLGAGGDAGAIPQVRGSYDDYMQMLDELDEFDDDDVAERLDELNEAPAESPPAPVELM